VYVRRNVHSLTHVELAGVFKPINCDANRKAPQERFHLALATSAHRAGTRASVHQQKLYSALCTALMAITFVVKMQSAGYLTVQSSNGHAGINLGLSFNYNVGELLTFKRHNHIIA
jgi:hypothetical protein